MADTKRRVERKVSMLVVVVLKVDGGQLTVDS
jgi:hypothetical protein